MTNAETEKELSAETLRKKLRETVHTNERLIVAAENANAKMNKTVEELRLLREERDFLREIVRNITTPKSKSYLSHKYFT